MLIQRALAQELTDVGFRAHYDHNANAVKVSSRHRLAIIYDAREILRCAAYTVKNEYDLLHTENLIEMRDFDLVEPNSIESLIEWLKSHDFST